MFAFFRIERPTNATLRPHSMPTSAACCMRCTFDANDETRMRPVRCGKIWRNASPTTRSDCGDARRARRSSSRRAAARRRGCRSRRACRRRCAGRRPACGRACSRPCARRGRPASRATTAAASGIECAMRTNSMRKGPSWNGSSYGRLLPQLGLAQQAVLVELRLDEAERQPRRDDDRDPAPRASGTAASRRGPRGRA